MIHVIPCLFWGVLRCFAYALPLRPFWVRWSWKTTITRLQEASQIFHLVLFVYFFRMAIIDKYRDSQPIWIPAQESAKCWDWWSHSYPFRQQRQPLHGMPKWQLQTHSSFAATSRASTSKTMGREYQVKSSLHPGDWQKALHCAILLSFQIAFHCSRLCRLTQTLNSRSYIVWSLYV